MSNKKIFILFLLIFIVGLLIFTYVILDKRSTVIDYDINSIEIYARDEKNEKSSYNKYEMSKDDIVLISNYLKKIHKVDKYYYETHYNGISICSINSYYYLLINGKHKLSFTDCSNKGYVEGKYDDLKIRVNQSNYNEILKVINKYDL
jgi:hypothetical protein